MTDIEKLANQIMAECEKDGESIEFEDALEMAKMEINAKRILPNAQADAPRKERKPKEIKVSAEKVDLFNLIFEGLDNYYENVEIVKNYKEIELKINDKRFKIDIVEHRPPKKSSK